MRKILFMALSFSLLLTLSACASDKSSSPTLAEFNALTVGTAETATTADKVGFGGTDYSAAVKKLGEPTRTQAPFSDTGLMLPNTNFTLKEAEYGIAPIPCGYSSWTQSLTSADNSYINLEFVKQTDGSWYLIKKWEVNMQPIKDFSFTKAEYDGFTWQTTFQQLVNQHGNPADISISSDGKIPQVLTAVWQNKSGSEGVFLNFQKEKNSWNFISTGNQSVGLK